MAPPAKRRRKNVLSSSSSASEDEDDEPITKSKPQLLDLVSSSPPSSTATKMASSKSASQKPAKAPVKLQPRAKTANHPHNAAPIYLPSTRGKAASKSASTSPEKPKKKGKMDEKGKSGDIFTFFTKQAQRQQAESSMSGTGVKSKLAMHTSSAEKVEDVDMISDDDVLGPSSTQGGSLVGLAARKRARATDAFAAGDGELPCASQRFMKPAKPVAMVKIEDTRPWAEKFAPKKVSDVRTWLENVMDGRLRHQRLLVLKGGAGTGKTTTIQLLAKAMECDVLEWHNPVGSVASSDGYLSMAAQFEEFMGRGGKFGQLDIFSSDGTVPSKPEDKPLDRRKNIILIEEFPNTFTRSSTALQSFRSAILQYLAANTPQRSMMFTEHPDEPITPVVMIISETLLTTASASADSFTAHRLLGAEILQHPGVGVIEFNAIAPTILSKALETIVQKESRKSGRRTTPGPMVLKKLGEIGDIRSAVAALEFLCLRGDTDGDWGAKVAFGKAKKTGKDVALTSMEKESLELVTRREASLGIFHAVGKVVYNKRDEYPPAVSKAEDVEKLPGFMSLHSRQNRSQVVVNDLIDETGTNTQTFVAALHENYILSCDTPPDTYDFSSLDHVNGCIDALSDSDLLYPSWDGSINPTGFGGGIGGRGSGGDILRQDEITFHIAVRGLLFSLPHPVKRKAPAAGGLRTGKGGDAFKMFYPTSLKLWRMREEIESAIDLWVSRLMKGESDHSITNGAARFARPKAGTVESWKSSRPISTQEKGSPETATPLLSVGTSARKEMLLERLPYMLLVARGRRTTSSVVSIKEMEKVATFQGIGISSEESNDEGDDDDTGVVAEEWATDKAAEGNSPKKKGLVIRGRGAANGFPLQQQEQKLVLSDDDIEDD
ncbi:Rad17-domain-containing protein [Mollisia scopiformis]|uniref:Rad17-domain-containing protein n=1 Tax=Mollisia scopiformis TaxID=149040 RepID=A0A132B811_MOLSC|nr:Rad17-domain-containing protein [Mollisia scopiformis]KUJ08550.1 Rad17-domain-containing protein [Mollisia scopiformis]